MRDERRLRTLHDSRLHRQQTPVRQCPPEVQWLVKLLLRETQRPRPEWHVGKRGRKAWLKDVAGRRGRKA